MSRPPKIHPLFSVVDPEGKYNPTDIVNLAGKKNLITRVYPNEEEKRARTLARKAIVQFLHRHQIEPCTGVGELLRYQGKKIIECIAPDKSRQPDCPLCSNEGKARSAQRASVWKSVKAFLVVSIKKLSSNHISVSV